MKPKKRILIIDDDPVMHQLCRAFLERSGYQCLEASDGQEGLRKIREQRPDLVLLDYVMPGMDGAEVYAELHTNEEYRPFRDIPVIVLTGREDGEAEKSRLLESGVRAYLVKPFGFRELKNVIENVFITHEIERRSMELQREIQETRDHLALILDNVPVGIFSTDAEGRITRANAFLARLLQFQDASDLVGKNILEEGLFGRIDLARGVAKVLREGGCFEANAIEVRTAPERVIKVNFRCVPLWKTPGQVAGLTGIVEDVTQAEHRAHELSMLYQMSQAMTETLHLDEALHLVLTCVTAGCALGFSRAMILLVDEEGKTLEGRMGVGPASREDALRIWEALAKEHDSLPKFLEKFGKQPPAEDDVFNNLVKELRVSLDWEDDVLVRTMKERRPFHVVDSYTNLDVSFEFLKKFRAKEFVTVPLIAKDRVIGVLVADNQYNAQPIGESQVQLLSLFANRAALAIEIAEAYQSLEEEKQKLEIAYRELKEAQDRLLHSERLAAIGEMAAHVAHEIRNPLVTIGGFARSILKAVKAENDPIRKSAQIVAEEVRRLERILANVLDFTKLSPPQPRPGNINEVLEDTCALLSTEVSDRHVELVQRFDPTIPPVLLDVPLMKQAVLNVLQNALHSMPKGGRLEVITTWDGKDWVTVEIRDTGIGIPPDVLKEMFNPFFTTRPDGTGLGLAITRKIVNDHGGRIQVESQVGMGTAFRFTLPLRFEFDEVKQTRRKDDFAPVAF